MVTPDERTMSSSEQIVKNAKRASLKKARLVEQVEDSEKENNEGMYLQSDEMLLIPILQTITLTRVIQRVPVVTRRWRTTKVKESARGERKVERQTRTRRRRRWDVTMWLR
jgi:hypothetical protein